jgi:hypothetical protein
LGSIPAGDIHGTNQGLGHDDITEDELGRKMAKSAKLRLWIPIVDVETKPLADHPASEKSMHCTTVVKNAQHIGTIP